MYKAEVIHRLGARRVRVDIRTGAVPEFSAHISLIIMIVRPS